VKRAYFIGIHIVLMVLIVMVVSQRRRTSSEPAEPVMNEVNQRKIVPVITERPSIGDISYRVPFTGAVSGEEEATIFSDVPGRFLKYLVGEGRYVEKGTPVALVEREIPGLQFEPVQVETPISGVVSRLPLEPGQAISPQMPIARAAKIGRVKVLFQAPEIHAGAVTAGKEVTVEVASQQKPLEGKIAWVSTFLDPATRTVSAYALINNSERLLKPGMFAKVRLVVDERKEALTLPSSAVLGFENKYVFIVEEGRAQRREVNVGLDDGTRAEILGGLGEEDVAIVVGQEIVEEGDTLDISYGGKK